MLPAGILTSPRAVIDFNGFRSTQVNLGLGGQNMINDAANEPSLAVDPTAPNRIAVGWRQFDSTASNFRQGGFSSSRDGGRTWVDGGVLEPGVFRSDPVLNAAADGTLYYMSLSVVPWPTGPFLEDVFISQDGGLTWPEKHFCFGGDKSWFVVDNTGGLGDGNLYQAWNTAGNQFFPAQFNRSFDGGVTWEDPVEFEPGNGANPARPVFGTVAVGPTGQVFVAGARNSTNTGDFWVVRSTNAMVSTFPMTFSQIVPVNLGGNIRIGVGPNPSGLLGQVFIEVDKSGGATHGNVYVLCSVDPPGVDPMDIHFIRSEDGGATWSNPVKINDDIGTNAWQWFGTMSVAPNGRIDVAWNDTRNSGQTNVSELFYSSSVDGGLTWSPNVQVTPSFDSWVGWPQQNKLGDYYDMESDAVGASLIWAATFNGEQDVYFTRLGDYDCNGNGLSDSVDLAVGSSGDCNGNGIPDECEIAAGVLVDSNGDGVPDTCGCVGDIAPPGPPAGNGTVNIDDLVAVLNAFGPCPAPPGLCAADITPSGGNGVVNIDDLVAVLNAFGACP